MLQNLRSSVKNTLIYGLGNLANKLVGFILIPVYVGHFSVQTYGMLGLLEVSGTALISILGLALTQALYRYYYDEAFQDRRRQMFFTILSFLLVFLGVFIGALYFITPHLSQLIFGDGSFAQLVWLLLCASGLQILVSMTLVLIQLQQKALLYTISNIAVLATQLFFTVWFITSKGLGLSSIYYAQIISLVLFFLIVAPFIWRNTRPRFEWDILREMLSYSLPWLLSNAAALIISISDRFFIRVFGELGDLGVYQFGFKIANTLSVLVIASAQMAIFPMMFSKMNDPDVKRFFQKVMTYFTFAVMFFVLFLNLFGLEIVKVLAKKPEYWASFNIIPLISLGLVFSMLRDLSSVSLQVVKKSGLISKIIITSAIFSLGLNYLLIPPLGSLGAGIAFIIAQIGYFLLMNHYAQKHFSVPYEYVKVLKMLILGVLLFIVAQLIYDWPLLIRLTSKLILIGLFPVFLYFMKFYEPVELDSMRGFIRTYRHPSAWRRLFNK
jgi:O-antigen/teichoic acid export membrane protein